MADKEVSGLTAAGTLDGTELIHIVQSSNSRQSTTQDIANLKTSDVTSVFSRTGAVVAADGDYTLDQIATVDLTTAAPTTNDVLTYDGTNWVPQAASGGSATFSGALVAKAANQTAADYTTTTSITWDSEAYDTDGYHDNATNSERLTVPAGGGGKYIIKATVVVTNMTDGLYAHFLMQKNGGSFTGMGQVIYDSVAAAQFRATIVSAVVDLIAGDYVTADLAIQNDTSVTIESSSSWLSIEKVSS